MYVCMYCTYNRPFPSSVVPLFQNESKCETFHMKMSSTCSFIFMQIKVIFIRMVSHLASLWNGGTKELGNGLLSCMAEDKFIPKILKFLMPWIQIVKKTRLKIMNVLYEALFDLPTFRSLQKIWFVIFLECLDQQRGQHVTITIFSFYNDFPSSIVFRQINNYLFFTVLSKQLVF